VGLRGVGADGDHGRDDPACGRSSDCARGVNELP
jgi:hypothetical protein